MIFDYLVHKEMIKMNSLLYFVSFVFTCFISTINSLNMTQTDASLPKGPGISSCYYFGTLDTSCGLEVVPVSCLPAECTSFFLDCLTVDLTHDVVYGTSEDEGFLDELLECGKPVYMRFGHATLNEWTQVFGCSACSEVNACDEMAGVAAYLKGHPGIAGLVLLGLTPDVTDKVSFPGLSESLKTYITVMKSTFNGLQIALSLPGWFFIDYCDDPKVKWFDFTILDSVVDFYEIVPGCIEDCAPEFRNIGAGPITGNSTYTLEKIASYIPKMKIPKDKVYFRYELNPNSPDPNIDDCETSSERMCTDPEYSKDWCSPTLKLLYDKGVYSHANGNGFIGANIDFDDPYGCCGCKPFPSFHALLDGFNCCEPPAPCPKFDRM